MQSQIDQIIKQNPYFSYNELLSCINLFSKYNIQISSIGTSTLGQEIYILKIGKGPYRIHVNASVHANEWITTPILIKFISDIYDSMNYQNILHHITLDVVPMVNPDGVNLACNQKLDDLILYNKLVKLNQYSTDFTAWKSNIRGVDLNRNFPAEYNKYKYEISKKNDTDHPSPKFYAGPYSLSESESKALCRLCKTRNYDMAVSLHTQGRELYYSFNNLEPDCSYKLAKQFSQANGYKVEQPEVDSSFAGFKDWFIQEFHKPGFTFELGEGENPLDYSTFDSLYEEVYPLLESMIASFE